eukprot:510779_1
MISNSLVRFKPTHVYVKICNHCWLKYFGITSAIDPYSYKGSGTRWTMHIKEHQSDIRTIIVNHFTDAYSCNTFCMQFSIVNDIVNSNEWANKVMELGWGAFIHTEESKRKISQKNKGRICSEATRKKISESHQGERNPMFGKKHTDKAKQKMKGRKCSEETRRKKSESMQGERNHMFGKKHTDETKRKMSESRKRLSEQKVI